MTEQRTSALEFPCDFPIKVMGHGEEGFHTLVVEIANRHAGPLHESAVSVRASSGGKYLAVTVTVRAESQDQLDNLYRELSGHERVVMVL